jgi:hypothetical protein
MWGLRIESHNAAAFFPPIQKESSHLRRIIKRRE